MLFPFQSPFFFQTVKTGDINNIVRIAVKYGLPVVQANRRTREIGGNNTNACQTREDKTLAHVGVSG